MIRIYATAELTSKPELVYDSRVEGHDLLGLTITTGLNKGGTADITLPPSHFSRHYYEPYQTLVEIYRDDDLRFRGRVLCRTYNFDNTMTVTCEGEMCFLQDYYSTPYKYTDTPANLFSSLILDYNLKASIYRKFKMGSITVPAARRTLELENEEAATALEIINTLLELCGGYIVFTTDTNGERVINWLADVGNDNQQVIDVSENLFDFSRTYENTEMCTVVRPYGAKDALGKRLDIRSVYGSDTISDDEAVLYRGRIVRAPVWDEVTDANVLLELGQQYLEEHKRLINSMTVSALDLSYINKSIESFKLGDNVLVVSMAHGVNDRFRLSEITEDLLNPDRSLINLGRETKTLTGLSVAGDSKAHRRAQKASSRVTSTSQDINALVADLQDRLLALEQRT